ncbi:MAG: hypothetical protein ACLFWD_01265 [Anaerolineales bacterium]
MFIVNPAFSLVAVTVVLVFYGILVRRSLTAPFGDVRSGLFVAVAEWAAKRVAGLPALQARAWKPNLLVPVLDTRQLRGDFRFIHDVTYPKGTIRLIGLSSSDHMRDGKEELEDLASAFRQEGVFASWSTVDGAEFRTGIGTGMDTLVGSFFRPNILFLGMPESKERSEDVTELIGKAKENKRGVLVFADHPQARLGRRQVINLWLSDRSPNWELSMDIGNADLAILVSYKLLQNWNGDINLLTAVSEDQVEPASAFLENLSEVARLPSPGIHVIAASFDEACQQAPQADLSVFGLPDEVKMEALERMRDRARSACVFVQDSGQENALA